MQQKKFWPTFLPHTTKKVCGKNNPEKINIFVLVTVVVVVVVTVVAVAFVVVVAVAFVVVVVVAVAWERLFVLRRNRVLFYLVSFLLRTNIVMFISEKNCLTLSIK